MIAARLTARTRLLAARIALALRKHGVGWVALSGRSQTRRCCAARREVAIAMHENGWTLVEIARFLGRDFRTVSGVIGRSREAGECAELGRVSGGNGEG